MLLDFKVLKLFLLIIQILLRCSDEGGVCGFPGDGVQASQLDPSEVFAGLLISASSSKYISGFSLPLPK